MVYLSQPSPQFMIWEISHVAHIRSEGRRPTFQSSWDNNNNSFFDYSRSVRPGLFYRKFLGLLKNHGYCNGMVAILAIQSHESSSCCTLGFGSLDSRILQSDSFNLIVNLPSALLPPAPFGFSGLPFGSHGASFLTFW